MREDDTIFPHFFSLMMMSILISASLISVFLVIFFIEDLEDSLYDPSSVHKPHKTLKERLKNLFRRDSF